MDVWEGGGQDFDPTLIWRIFSPFSAMKTRGLNHSATLPFKLNLVYASRDVTLAPTAQPMDFLEGKDFDPTLIRRIFSPFSTMKTRCPYHTAILPSKYRLTPAIVTTGRVFITSRPAYGLS